MQALADLFLEMEGGADKALELFNEALQHDPRNRWYYLVRIAEVYQSRGWQAEARELLEQALPEIPSSHADLAERIRGALAGGPSAPETSG